MANTYYDEENHKYYVNGVETPSVTEIANPISFERLNELQKHLVERARMRGQRCHEIAEEYLCCEEIEAEEFYPEEQAAIAEPDEVVYVSEAE